MSDNILEKIISELILIADPVKGAGNDEESLKYFFKPMGWNFDNNSGMPLANITNTVTEIAHLLEIVQEIVDDGELESLEQILQLLTSIKSLFESIDSLANSFDGANLSTGQIMEVMDNMVHHLLVTYLQKKQYLLVEVLRWIEVIQVKQASVTEFNNAGKIIRYPYAFEVFNFDNLGKFVSNPAGTINDIYFAPFDRNTVAGAKAFTDKLFPRIGRIAEALGAIYVYGIKPAYGINFGVTGNEMASGALTVKWRTPLDELDFGSTLTYSPRDRGNLGWIIVPFGELKLDTILGNYYFRIKSVLQVGGIIIGDDGAISFESSDGLTKVSAELLAKKLPEEDSELSYLIGEKDGTRLEIGEVSIGGSFGATTSKIDFDTHLNINKAKFVLGAKGQDGFIEKILPEMGIEISFDFLLGYSTQKSLYFGANAGLELAIPIHKDILGVLRVDEIYLKIKTQDYGLKTEASVTGGVSLGPLNVSFEEIGLQSKLDWTSSEKNIGFANFSVGFKPPNGLGLSINVGAVIGGGYLFFDFDKQEYAGILELTIAGFISVKAIGLIATKMPDGSPGFSMLIIITCEFLPPFQLSYGFTLNGVGGLLGLNRSVMLDPLREGVKSGSVNNIMFPQNVIANAPRIISDLRTIFPIYEGKFLIGPMAKIGWGTPSIITLSLGLIIEIPGNIAILGVLKVALPIELAPIVQIQVAFLGTIDFDKGMLTFDASLYESFILTMTLEGDMAVRLKWGESPDFLITVGGFHPEFNPPPLALPTLRRLAINILSTDVASIRIECYQALTSNSAQFGAYASIHFDLSACTINGEIGFDALFKFSPFNFVITASANFKFSAVGIDVSSVHINMSLDGPTPWRAKGTGSVSLLVCEISADFDETWGIEANITLPNIEVLPKLLIEFDKKESWSTALSNTNNVLVTLRKISEEETDLLVMHPAGSLMVQQKLIPLTVEIDKVGNQKSSDLKLAKFVSANSNGVPFILKNVNDNFARAQYKNLSDAQKLSLPSFEKMPGGVEISMINDLVKNGKVVRKNVEYELTIIDKEPKKVKGKKFRDSNRIFGKLLNGNHCSKSKFSKNYSDQIKPFEQKITMSDERFTVAFKTNNKAVNEYSTFDNEMQASTYLAEIVQNEPSLHNTLQIIPNFELEPA